jgi:hypothetical protein
MNVNTHNQYHYHQTAYNIMDLQAHPHGSCFELSITNSPPPLQR